MSDDGIIVVIGIILVILFLCWAVYIAINNMNEHNIELKILEEKCKKIEPTVINLVEGATSVKCGVFYPKCICTYYLVLDGVREQLVSKIFEVIE